MKIRELFSDKSKWTQGTLARSLPTRAVSPNSPKAKSWCLYGAAERCYRGRNVGRVLDILRSEIGLDISYYNDSFERKFEDIKALVEKLDI